jgi:hypothetical protein
MQSTAKKGEPLRSTVAELPNISVKSAIYPASSAPNTGLVLAMVKLSPELALVAEFDRKEVSCNTKTRLEKS